LLACAVKWFGGRAVLLRRHPRQGGSSALPDQRASQAMSLPTNLPPRTSTPSPANWKSLRTATIQPDNSDSHREQAVMSAILEPLGKRRKEFDRRWRPARTERVGTSESKSVNNPKFCATRDY